MEKDSQGDRDQSMKATLLQRDQERKSRLRVLKEEKESLCPDQKKLFETTFNKQTKIIDDNLKLIEEKNVDEINLPEHIRSIKKEINSLNKYLAVSSKFVTNYTVKKGLETIENFEKKLTNLEAEFIPKKSFSFKAKQKPKEVKVPVANDSNGALDNKDEVDSVSDQISSLLFVACGFSDRKNENLKLCSSEIANNDVGLRNLDNCTVFLCGNPITLHMSNITRCRIFSGPVSTSVFIENCLDSDIVVACQQLRVHDTRDTRFYVHITSRAIIEDTCNAQFAPYNLEYDDLEMHFKSSGLAKSPNNWNMVDDFNWFVSGMHSPNWKIIDVDERVLNWSSHISF